MVVSFLKEMQPLKEDYQIKKILKQQTLPDAIFTTGSTIGSLTGTLDVFRGSTRPITPLLSWEKEKEQSHTIEAAMPQITAGCTVKRTPTQTPHKEREAVARESLVVKIRRMMDDSSNFFKANPEPLPSTLKCILGNDINRLHFLSSLRNTRACGTADGGWDWGGGCKYSAGMVDGGGWRDGRV